MIKKVFLVVVLITFIAIILLKYGDILIQKQFALITQKRYMRYDKMLLTEKGVGMNYKTVDSTYNEKLSSVSAVIFISIQGVEYDCSPELTTIGRYIDAVLSVQISSQQLYNNCLSVTFGIRVYNLTNLIYKGTLETFKTEDFNYMLSLANANWRIYFKYDFIVDDYSFIFRFFYGDFGFYGHSYIDGITFYLAEPKADFTYSPTQIIEGDEVVFDASISQNACKIIGYYWEISKDSTVIYKTNTTIPKMSYIFTQHGYYSVQLTITDEFMQTSTKEKTIQVLKSLIADFLYTGKSYTCEYLTFHANVTSKYEIQKYIWNFGDNNITETETNNINHFYKNSGTYTVTLTVIDVRNNQDSISKLLNIKESTYKIFCSPNKVLKGVNTLMELNLYKNEVPYIYANIVLLSKDFSIKTQTNNVGKASVNVMIPERGEYVVEILDSNFDITIGNFHVYSTVEPLLNVQCEKQQFYNIIGQNDFLLTTILFDPDTYSPITDYEPTVYLTSEGVEIPNEIYRENNRFIVTAKVFNIFNNTKERTINVYIKVTSNIYYNTSFNTTVKMLAPVIDYWICDSSGNPLPTNLRTGTQGFAIKLIKPEYLNVTKDNIYIEIRSPLSITTSKNLTLSITEDYIHVDYVFTEEGVYEITVGMINLPLFVPTRTYIYTVQEPTVSDYISTHLQYIFTVAVIILVLYLLKKRR